MRKEESGCQTESGGSEGVWKRGKRERETDSERKKAKAKLIWDLWGKSLKTILLRNPSLPSLSLLNTHSLTLSLLSNSFSPPVFHFPILSLLSLSPKVRSKEHKSLSTLPEGLLSAWKRLTPVTLSQTCSCSTVTVATSPNLIRRKKIGGGRRERVGERTQKERKRGGEKESREKRK